MPLTQRDVDALRGQTASLASGVQRSIAERRQSERDAQAAQQMEQLKQALGVESEIQKRQDAENRLRQFLKQYPDRAVNVEGMALGGPTDTIATKKPSVEEMRRNALAAEAEVRAANLQKLYAEAPQWKQVAARVPGIGKLLGAVDPQVREIQAEETAIPQIETFIKSGAQAPETEYNRMRTSVLPGVLDSPESKQQVLRRNIEARKGIPSTGAAGLGASPQPSVRKQYSPSRNQTRVIDANGNVIGVEDGDTRGR